MRKVQSAVHKAGEGKIREEGGGGTLTAAAVIMGEGEIFAEKLLKGPSINPALRVEIKLEEPAACL
ncbi:hypothetical protein N2605_26820 [Bradyrhizobium yuanmingense]|uniref:hypothetical protein n=1 Tax=Bradyrhizobium yuanmingense TaxID=108015 RepID=UPI0021A72488|nr:hypothetical protein [Bradyrhizobium sp. CB1024]UWU83142.1 hypothetical protein N2605_26820 [Bradyrhizobium sp. CB1024]